MEFFRNLTERDGAAIARSTLQLSEPDCCTDEGGFVEGMEGVFSGLSAEAMRCNTPQLIADMMQQLRKYHVTLKREVSVVVVSIMVLEGWACRLDPDIRIIPEIARMVGGRSHMVDAAGAALPIELQMAGV